MFPLNQWYTGSTRSKRSHRNPEGSQGQVRVGQEDRYDVRGPHPLLLGGLPSQLWFHPPDPLRGPRPYGCASTDAGAGLPHVILEGETHRADANDRPW